MGTVHARAEAAGKQRHVNEAHHRAAVDRTAHVHMILGRHHTDNPMSRAIGPEQQPAGGRREARAGEVSPAVPALIVGIGRRAARDSDVLQPLGLVVLLAHVACALRLAAIRQAARSAISFLVSAIALAGLRPLGQTFAQFMIVWQRYRRYGSSSWSSRSPVASSRLSAIQRYAWMRIAGPRNLSEFHQ